MQLIFKFKDTGEKLRLSEHMHHWFHTNMHLIYNGFFFNTLRLRQNGQHSADDICKFIFLYENRLIFYGFNQQ